MALLFWVNDPAALRQFVATNSDSSVPSAMVSAPTGVAELSGGATANQNRGVSPTELSSGGPHQSQNESPATTENQLLAALVAANQNSDCAQIVGAAGGAAHPPNGPLRQNSMVALRFQQLQASLGAAGQYSRAVFGSTAGSSAQGQFLNISA